MNSRDNAVIWLATGFRVGRVPFAPGTFGSVLGLPLAWGLAGLGPGVAFMGLAVALAGLPFTLFNVAAGFAAFRILDIVKPFPARLIDTRMSGGAGVVLDDVVAGI